jgi:2-polyprenyl-3-methyl-5-hydroxy-6-metoxy-1,4-benzoquinol methylase
MNNLKDQWNQRYGQDEFIYGTAPNEFFKTQLDLLAPGKILLPAEGQGRNAVYAAVKGWQVTAVDISEKGRAKAMEHAKMNTVDFDYLISEFGEMEFHDNIFDAAALIFFHIPSGQREF